MTKIVVPTHVYRAIKYGSNTRPDPVVQAWVEAVDAKMPEVVLPECSACDRILSEQDEFFEHDKDIFCAMCFDK